MKWVVSILVALLLGVTSGTAFSPYVRRIGDVRVWRNWMIRHEPRVFDGATYLEIMSWKSGSLPANLDSAFVYARRDSTFRESNITPVILLTVPACSNEDSSCVNEVAGRFAPQGLLHIQPTGTWQWSGPLVVTVVDTARCPLIEQLQERRWTIIQVVDAHYNLKAFRAEVNDLVRRYKRERMDRLEDMFRK